MLKLFTNISTIVTVNTQGKNIKKGTDASELYPLQEHSIITEDGIIKDIIPSGSVKAYTEYDDVIDAEGRILLPGLVECHTHAAYAGSRANEFGRRLKGVSYEEIASEGGGINRTVDAVRNSSFDKLAGLLKPRIDNFISQGITSLEIKSGYGLSLNDETKLLKVINHMNELYSIDIYATFLGAHTFPPEYRDNQEGYVDLVINEMIPYISGKNLALYCDVFCEKTAFSADQTDRILKAAKSAGMKLRLHTDQFNNIGGVDTAIKNGALSVDHLEVAGEKEISRLAEAETVTAVLLPGVSFYLGYDYAPARKLIENNVPVALSTDFNPGSSHISDMRLIMSLAALKGGMNIDEIISGVTINAASALGINDTVGSIEIGKNADFAIFNTENYEDLVYLIGSNLTYKTVKNGTVIYQQN